MRRLYNVHLDAGVDRPARRNPKDFRHPDLRQWVQRNREELVWSALILIQHWIVQGRPEPNDVPYFGSFESFRHIVGGTLEACGIKGFLGNLRTFQDHSDGETQNLEVFVNAWWTAFSGTAVKTSKLFDLVMSDPDILIPLGRSQDEHGRKIYFGRFISKLVNRCIDRFKIIDAGTLNRAKLFQLVPVSDEKEQKTHCTHMVSAKNSLINPNLNQDVKDNNEFYEYPIKPTHDAREDKRKILYL